MPASFGIRSRDVNWLPKNTVNIGIPGGPVVRAWRFHCWGRVWRVVVEISIFQNKGPDHLQVGVMPSSAFCSSCLLYQIRMLKSVSKQVWD